MSSRQLKFAELIMLGMWQTKAYKAAGYAWRGMHRKTLYAESYRLKHNWKVQEWIRRVREAYHEAAAKSR